jgi:hypothetical protein
MKATLLAVSIGIGLTSLVGMPTLAAAQYLQGVQSAPSSSDTPPPPPHHQYYGH